MSSDVDRMLGLSNAQYIEVGKLYREAVHRAFPNVLDDCDVNVAYLMYTKERSYFEVSILKEGGVNLTTINELVKELKKVEPAVTDYGNPPKLESKLKMHIKQYDVSVSAVERAFVRIMVRLTVAEVLRH